MCNHISRIKLAEGNLRTFQARLSTAADKDTVRRQIKAIKARLHALSVDHEQCA